MAIILDADVIIRGEKGTFDLKNWVTSRPNDRFEIAAITVAELWDGVERATGTHKVARQRYLDAVLELPIISTQSRPRRTTGFAPKYQNPGPLLRRLLFYIPRP
jgi:predicted nucleic acid-binding protein